MKIPAKPDLPAMPYAVFEATDRLRTAGRRYRTYVSVTWFVIDEYSGETLHVETATDLIWWSHNRRSRLPGEEP